MNSLNIEKPNSETKVVVAMSGGVDSSTVAGLMKKEGYKVIGITLKLYDDAKSSTKTKQCCAGQDIMDAKRVSQILNIDHKILYYQNKFSEEVINDFIDGYSKGETPIPCVKCNQTVKFRDLLIFAKEMKADALITGHYVGLVHNKGHSDMYRAIDLKKDQSYFLFNTKQDQLNYLRFPLGRLTKKQTRSIAQKLKLNVANKPDSQDICFVPNGDYASVIKKFKPEVFVKGKIKNLKGKVIGEHDGIVNFTIGQRKGIKIAEKYPLYVTKINAKSNEIIVGPKDSLKVNKIYLRDLNFLDDLENYKNNLFVKVRSTSALLKAEILLKKNSYLINLEKGEYGISPGQACVFYSKNNLGDKVLGGGWISETLNSFYPHN